jgi:hypothetical protein
MTPFKSYRHSICALLSLAVAATCVDSEAQARAQDNALPISFNFTVGIDNLVQPTNCLDAAIIGNGLETALNIGLGSGSLACHWTWVYQSFIGI